MKTDLTQTQQKLSTGNEGRSIPNEIREASNTKLICNCGGVDDLEIREIFRYIFVLWGLPEKQIPDAIGRGLLIRWVKKTLWNVPKGELMIAFEYALENRLDVKKELFGATFSAKIVYEVWEAYKKYKNNLRASLINKKKEIEARERIREGYKKSKEKAESSDPVQEKIKMVADRIKQRGENRSLVIEYDPYQKLLKKWDKLSKYNSVPGTSGRFINYKGYTFNVQEFIKFECERLYLKQKSRMATERLLT